MKIGHTIDSEGFYIGDVLEDSGINPDVMVICPDGFIRPKWDGTRWVEGGIAPEPLPILPTEAEQIVQLKAQLKRSEAIMYDFIGYYFQV
jgi:hypothetical protein